MRNSELIIEPPVPGYRRSEEELAKWKGKYTALPGRVVVLMDPPRDTHGGLVLPDSLNDKIRPECGTVIAGLTLGLRVILRPYAGLWMYVDGEQIRFLNDIEDDIIAGVSPLYPPGWEVPPKDAEQLTWRGFGGEGIEGPPAVGISDEAGTKSIASPEPLAPRGRFRWRTRSVRKWRGWGEGFRPLGNWLEVEREANETTLEVSELGKRGWRHTARVIALSTPNPLLSRAKGGGSRVVLTSDENAFLRIRWQDQDRCFIREVNRDGVRQVWAVIDPPTQATADSR